MHLKYSVLLVLLYLTNQLTCTLSPTNHKEKIKKKIKLKRGPVDKNVFERNLVQENPTPNDILVENQAYYRDVHFKNFNGTVLGYVTPWNSHGYDVAQTFANKLSLISPVWLQVKREQERNYVITGKHDIDKNWVENVKKSGTKSNIKIVPRVLFENWSPNDISKAVRERTESLSLGQTLSDTCIKEGFDGFVLEVWSQWMGRVDANVMIDFISVICARMHSVNLQCILVVPPWQGSNNPDLFSRDNFNKLYGHVTAFSLMTYDFSNPERPGPNSPIPWVEKCVSHLVPDPSDKEKRAAILVGVNLYGNAYTPHGGGPIVATQYIDLLGHHHTALKYDSESKEHYFDVKTPTGRQVVFYPTLHSLYSRIQLAEQLGVGLALWELGQGLDYFYDLF